MPKSNVNVDRDEVAHSDFGLVAAIIASGFSIQRTERKGTRIFFVFIESPQLHNIIDDYWSGELLISARQYFDSTKMLKSRIYGG